MDTLSGKRYSFKKKASVRFRPINARVLFFDNWGGQTLDDINLSEKEGGGQKELEVNDDHVFIQEFIHVNGNGKKKNGGRSRLDELFQNNESENVVEIKKGEDGKKRGERVKV